MRTLCLITLVYLSLNLPAQDCKTHSLFKEGTELEYAQYMPKVGLFGADRGFFPTTRLILTVKKVTDSAGATYSIISKKGVAYNDPRDNYKKTMTIKCDGKSMFISVDAFSPDTMYLVDVYPTVKGKGFYYASKQKTDPATWTIPIALDGGGSASIDKKNYKMSFISRDYAMEQTRPNSPRTISGTPVSNELEIETEIENIKITGKAKVKTRAGEFDCYKIEIKAKAIFGRNSLPGSTVMYFHPEIGLVKTESFQARTRSGYSELVNVKD